MNYFNKGLVVLLVLCLFFSTFTGMATAEEAELTLMVSHHAKDGMTITGPALIEKEAGWQKVDVGETYTLTESGHVNVYEGNQAGLDNEYSRLTTEHLPGDVNGDGVVNVQDVVLIIQYVLELIDLTEEQKRAAGVRGDEEIDVRDVALVMQYSLAIIDTLKPDPDPGPDPEPDPEAEMWLTIPSIGVSTAVIDGQPWVDGATLPQHMHGDKPGEVENSNTAIGGYSATHGAIFSELEYLTPGDTFSIEYDGVTYNYEIVFFRSYVEREHSYMYQEPPYDVAVLLTFTPTYPDYDEEDPEGDIYVEATGKLVSIEE